MLPMIATPPGQGALARQAQAKAQAATYGFIYRTQPAVRKVVDYIARNSAQVGVKLYARSGDDDRREVRDHPAAESLRRPAGRLAARRFWYGMIADHLVYENAYAVKFRVGELIRLWRVPVWAVEVLTPTSAEPSGYRVHFRDGTFRDLATDDVLHLSGYDPDDPAVGLSRLETLRLILTEESMNQAANVERLRHGGLGPGYIERPVDAPDWSDDARSRFETDWSGRARGRGDGERIDPVLEEGMKFHESSVTPKDAEMLRGRLFTRAEVASLYGLPACLVEADDEKADRAEARKQFYADTLPPLLGPLADDLNLQILDEEYDAADDHYYEWNLSEKLRGQVEERFKTLVTAAGAPILTRNEARRRENLPEVEGGDELITPLNVVSGDNPKPSPNSMGPQDPNGPSQDGDERADATALERADAARAQAELIARREAQGQRRDRYAEEHSDLLRATFARQRRSYRSSKSFDVERWNAELADDLEAQAVTTVEREGGIAAERLATPAGFDLERCRAYLRRGAEERAKAINATTANAIAEYEADQGDDEAARPSAERRDPFDEAEGERAEQAGIAIGTSLAAFSHAEAARQAPDASSRVKTWVVMSGNSRHPQLNGETVPVFDAFSNGGQYPGDPRLGADETARCRCLLEVA